VSVGRCTFVNFRASRTANGVSPAVDRARRLTQRVISSAKADLVWTGSAKTNALLMERLATRPEIAVRANAVLTH